MEQNNRSYEYEEKCDIHKEEQNLTEFEKEESEFQEFLINTISGSILLFMVSFGFFGMMNIFDIKIDLSLILKPLMYVGAILLALISLFGVFFLIGIGLLKITKAVVNTILNNKQHKERIYFTLGASFTIVSLYLGYIMNTIV